MGTADHTPLQVSESRSGFFFNKICVIESLPQGECRTGKALYDGILHDEDLLQDPEAKRRFSAEFTSIEGKKDLFEFLVREEMTLRSTGRIPLLHFEAHGSKEGLRLKSDEFVRYAEMFPLLRKINILSRHNLFVVAAACEGKYLAYELRNCLREPAPFSRICGPSQEISGDNMLKAFLAFYEKAFRSNDIYAAVQQARQALGSQDDVLVVEHSELLFIGAFKHYLKEWCTPEAVDERIRGICEKARAQFGDASAVERQEGQIRDRFGTHEGQKEEFERMKKVFFMHDRYPDDSHLPNPSFEVVLSADIE